MSRGPFRFLMILICCFQLHSTVFAGFEQCFISNPLFFARSPYSTQSCKIKPQSKPPPIKSSSEQLLLSNRRCKSPHREICMSEFKESRFQLSPGIEVKALEVKGWGWTGNENAYGLVIWPGARAVAKVMSKMPDLIAEGCKVVELGAGSGLCSLVCAARGAQVVATDLNLEPLNLAKKAAAAQGLTMAIQQFDILGPSPLPPCDVLVLADCIYTPELGRGVARRVLEAKARGATVVVGSSVNRPGYSVFQEELRRTGLVAATAERVVDFSSPLWLLDVVRGNYIQEVTIY
jgi:predicted nicotinamide N-methyase